MFITTYRAMDTILFAVAFFYLTKFFGIFIVSVYRKVSGFCGKAPRPGRPILPSMLTVSRPSMQS